MPSRSRLSWPGAAALLALAAYAAGLLWRFYWVMHAHPPRRYLYSDMQFYLELGQRLATPGYVLGPDDVTHPPGMALLIAWFIRHGWFPQLSDAIAILQLTVSALVPLAVALLAWQLFGRRNACWTLAACSLYFPFVDYAGYLLAEIYVMLLIPLVLAAFLAATRAGSGAGAVLLGLLGGALWCLGIAFKLVLLPGVLCFIAAYFLLRDGPVTRGRKLLVTVAMAAGLAPGLGWISHRATQANDGHWVLVSNKSASDFLLGHYGRINSIRWQDPGKDIYHQFGSPSAVQRGYTEVRTVNFGMTDAAKNSEAAWSWIRQHPLEALVLSCQHVYDLFFGGASWPSFATDNRAMAELFHYLFVALILFPCLAMIALTTLQAGIPGVLRRPEILVLSPLLGLMAAAFVATGEPRYRVPWDGLMIILAIEFYRRGLRRTLFAGPRTPPSGAAASPRSSD